MIGAGVRTFGGMSVDSTCWPLIVWDWPAAHVDDASQRATAAHLAWLWRQTPAGVRSFTVCDVSKIREPGHAAQRRAWADFTKEHTELLKRVSLGAALVTPSTIVRGALTAVHWLRPPPIPVTLLATRDEALRHGIRCIEDHGATLSPALMALRESLARPGARAAT